MQLGQKIRKLRELKDFTQEYMADKLDISQQAYSLLEKDDNIPFNRLKQISEVLEVPIEQIIGFDEKFVFNSYGANSSHIAYQIVNNERKLYEDKISLLEEILRLKDEEIARLKK